MIRQQTLWRTSAGAAACPCPAETTAQRELLPGAESQGWPQLHQGHRGRSGRKSCTTPQLLRHQASCRASYTGDRVALAASPGTHSWTGPLL